MSAPSDPPALHKKTASVPGTSKLRVPVVLRTTSMTTHQAQRTAALNLSRPQPTTVTYNDPAAVETPLNVEGGTPAAAAAPKDTSSIQGSLPDLQTVSDSSASNVTSSVNVEGIDPRVIISTAGAA
jgi:hypothetical protein